MSSNRMETIPDLNLPYMICQLNTHQTEVPAEDVPAEDVPAEDVLIGFKAPIHGDGAIVPANTEMSLSRKRRRQVEVPAQDAVDHAKGVAEAAGASADTEKLLFEKHRDLWEVAESFESFRKMPQDPHFLPLKSCKEVLREGQALGKMVTFDNIAKTTLNFHLDTKREAIKDKLSTLEELETHGFDGKILKDRLNRILMLKNEEEKVKNMSEQRKRVLSGHVQENYKFKEIRAKAEERIKELQKEVELVSKMEKNISAKKASGQQAELVNDEKRRTINMQIEEFIASPLH